MTILDIGNLFLILDAEYLIGFVTGGQIVDFSCGANDFSILMKKKLQETEKKCSYRNYDLLPTKVHKL